MNLEHEHNLELGKKSAYDCYYDASKLFAIPRASKRIEIGVNPDALPFYGYDSWNHYEVSWLNTKGKPIAAMAEIIYDCHSPNTHQQNVLVSAMAYCYPAVERTPKPQPLLHCLDPVVSLLQDQLSMQRPNY